MKLIAIRHGETEWNAQGREMGQLDSPLTPRGIRQAHAIARRLARVPFDALHSSDLGRAVQTADVIASSCGKKVTIDDGLRERHMGIFQGLTVAGMRERFPKERQDYERIGFEYVIPGGESARQRLERSVRVLTAIAERHPEETVVVVTHGGFLMGFFESVLGMVPGNGWRFKRHNGSYSAFEHVGGRWSLEVWNDVSHLDGTGSLDDPTVQAD
jgi:broad specificity phosphatase PhoE